MHASDLTFESALLLALSALFSAGVWLLLWRRTRSGYMLPLLAGWLLLCIYWSLLAVSSGPAPVLPRGDIAVAIRLIGIGAAGLLAAGKLALLRRMLRNGRDST